MTYTDEPTVVGTVRLDALGRASHTGRAVILGVTNRSLRA
jgi:hypothetical protein